MDLEYKGRIPDAEIECNVEQAGVGVAVALQLTYMLFVYCSVFECI